MKKLIPQGMALLMLFLISIGVPAKDTSSGKLLSDWISVHLKLVRTTQGVAHVAYSRHFSYTAIACYESAIIGDKKYRSLAGQLQGLNSLPLFTSPTQGEPAASANAAYAVMLRHFYGKNSNAYLIDSTEAANIAWLQQCGVTKDALSASSEFGKSVALAIIQWSETDGSEKADAPYSPPAGEGKWQLTPPSFSKAAMPYWENMRSLVSGSGTNVFAKMPPQYSLDPNSDYQKMVKEVYDVSLHLSEEQKNIALFWDDSPGEHLTVFGHWSSIVAQLIDAKKLSLMSGTEAYVKMHIALQDATMVAWHGKYLYNVLRPVSNIQKTMKAGWLPLIETPPHPEFPAAHATFSTAAATGLTSALGEGVAFTDNTYAYLGMPARKFPSIKDAAKEAGRSRLYGGIHYSFSINEGSAIGERTALNALKKLKFKN